MNLAALAAFLVHHCLRLVLALYFLLVLVMVWRGGLAAVLFTVGLLALTIYVLRRPAAAQPPSE